VKNSGRWGVSRGTRHGNYITRRAHAQDVRRRNVSRAAGNSEGPADTPRPLAAGHQLPEPRGPLGAGGRRAARAPRSKRAAPRCLGETPGIHLWPTACGPGERASPSPWGAHSRCSDARRACSIAAPASRGPRCRHPYAAWQGSAGSWSATSVTAASSSHAPAPPQAGGDR
jgi:hypothetical protein